MAKNVTVLKDENGLQREYHEVERKARVGERVKITEELMLGERHAGEVYTVIRIDGGSLIDTDGAWNDGSVLNLNHDEYVVLEPTGIVIIDGVRYREEKRTAAVGERILITNLAGGETRYRNGDVFTVARLDSDGDVRVDVDEYEDVYIPDDEYVVLTSVAEPSAPITITIPAIHVTVASMDDAVQAIADAVKVEISKIAFTPPKPKSAQELRDEIVERAKGDVTELECDIIARFHGFLQEDYVINREKRTVVALLRDISDGRVHLRGIAKCAPGDVFNSHIGRAIALRRALGLPVPDEYLNAPQPTEVRDWDVVLYGNHKFTITPGNRRVFADGRGEARIDSHIARCGKIVDDSREQTEVSA